MKFIHADSAKECAKVLAERIILELNEQKKVLWLIAGGSNLPIATATMDLIRVEQNDENLERLAVTLTDERYGKEGHKDSNFKQLLDEGFNTTGVQIVPILVKDLSVNQTVDLWGKKVTELISWADVVIAQFGMGTDGHIAGVVPHSVGVTSTAPAVAFTDPKFTRISLPLPMLKIVNVAHAFVFGASKHEAIHNLKKELTLAEEPAQILKQIEEAHLYSDQV